MKEQEIRKGFIKEFCNDHNHKVRFLRGVFLDDEDAIELITDYFLSLRKQELTQLIEELEGEKIKTKTEIEVGSEFSNPRLIRDNGFNNGISLAQQKLKRLIEE